MNNSSNSNLRVSIVLPAYNEEANLAQTLKSIKAQDIQEDFEIIVCDNGSTDNTLKIAHDLGAIVVHEPRKGSRFAYDSAVRASKGEIVLVTNADVTLPPNWAREIVNAYDSDPEVVGVGTRVRYANSPRYVNSFLILTEMLNPHRAMWGTSLSCTREVFDLVGGFDHGVNTNEDGIFSLLIEKYGKVIYLDQVTVLMDGRRFSGGLLSAFKEWVGSYGLNSIYIQINYMITGKIKSLVKDFDDIRPGRSREKTRSAD